ncbi:Protein kinase protein rad53 [Collariella sp. IMI 366227]|nr:Protein kinase protein rad53 [Collariella sp. IMI 366227]
MDPSSQPFSQPTQATQTVFDPRRGGQQDSKLSDEDVSDIICLLLPYSESAHHEVRRLASEGSPHTLGRNDVDGLRIEDDLNTLSELRADAGEYHIALRFSSLVKDPAQGFTFGRNPGCCDILLKNDPHRRLSKVHFRIYLNEWEVLMLEDMSTNGTVVDDHLLKRKDNPTGENKRTLASGSKIKVLMRESKLDLAFLVRIPNRDGPCEEAYQQNLRAYLADPARMPIDANATIVPGPGGHWPVEFKQMMTARGQAAVPVTLKFTGHPYAAKELDKRKFMKNGVLDQKVENEMRIMQRIKHANVVEYIEHIDWDDRLLIIIMEFVGGGDLGRLIAENGPLSETATKTMSRQLLDALGYLHDMNITHRDVKPDNILVSSHVPFVVKLTDFGLSKMVDNEQTFLRTFCGTLLYCAPEVYSEYAEYDDRGRRHPRNRRLRPATGQRYDHAVDIWSLGGVLFYALTKKPPFPARNGASHSELLHSIMTKPLDITPLLEAEVSEEAIDFLRRMLNRRPETRATIDFLQNHVWISSSFTTVAESFEAIEEEDLRVTASQLSLEDNDRDHIVGRELRVPSDDEITDEEDEELEGGAVVEYESEKENYTFGPNTHPQRLFGEVNLSAIRSSGGVAQNRLNLPVSAAGSLTSNGTTEILGNEMEIRDSFESEDSLTPRQKSQKSQFSGGLGFSIIAAGQSRSVEELNNMTFDVQSQSLGGAESILENLNMKSRAGSLLRSHTTGELNTSKRKPSTDSTEDDDMSLVDDRRGLKRLRSSKLTVGDAEYESLAQIPSIARTQSGRQIDNPVHKSIYWSAQDRRTWHLNYPEMTQLQLDAFKTAAKTRNEEFGPGKTPLWDLAMKYFPPTNCERRGDARKGSRDRDGERGLVPSTADQDALPTPLTHSFHEYDFIPRPPVVLPILSDPGRPVVACLESAPGSAVPGISVRITESMVSWGRAIENTRSYHQKAEGRVPKCAFKILLYKPNYDPVKNFRPWNRAPEPDESSFLFYISTKASMGIRVNNTPSSDDPKTPPPSRHWLPSTTATTSPAQNAFLGEHDLKMEEANHDIEERTQPAAVERERRRARSLR